MLRPHTPLFDAADDTPVSPAGISGLVMQRIAEADPEIAKLPSVRQAAGTKGAGDGQADAAAVAAAEKVKADAVAAAAKSKVDDGGGADDPDRLKAELQNEDPNEDDPDEEILPDDDLKVQLEKLRKAQKKVLGRLDKEVGKRKDLETKLAAAKPEERDEPAGEDMFPKVKTEEDLDNEVKNIDGWLAFLVKHAATGTTIKNADGSERELSPADIVQDVIFWTDVKANQVPEKRTFLKDRAKAQTEAADKFKPWQDKKAFTDAQAAVEAGMKRARSVIADYDVAVRERTLGRLALSDDYELVPKRKAAASGVESAPGKAKPPATPVNPPSSGGPPIKPAGAGPDLEQLKKNMMKNPGNPQALNAYIKAQLTAGKQQAA
ncbi:MAG: hypothetical protein ACYC67_27320 [Prosthecobacter sp.]